jgi:glyoxylase I family protein
MATTDQATDFAGRRDELKRRYLKPRAERPPSTARGLHHLALICSDVERTIQFYQGLLGFPLVELMENRDYKGSTHLFFDMGHDNLLAFFDFPGLGLKPGVEAIGGVQHIAISTDSDSFERVKAHLEQAGVPYLGPDRGAKDSIYFKDPDGIQIEFIREPLLRMDGRSLVD